MNTMSTMSKQRQPAGREAGMVSIMVTMILMVVLSLIVIGFAQIARRNARQTLDRQLSTSAFYAAESGVNDVRNIIATAGTPPEKTSCSNSGYGGYYNTLNTLSDVNAADNLSYTCVLVDPGVTTLPYTIGTTGTIVPLTAESGHHIDTLTFTWQKSTAAGITGCNGNLVPSTTWSCGYAGIRFDLVRSDGPLSLNIPTMSSFMLPVASGGVTQSAFTTNGGADKLKVTCTATSCALKINSSLGGSQYYLRVMSQYYSNVNFVITGTEGPNAVKFVGAQVLIDVTGKAQDVLRRVEVRVPVSGNSANLTSDYALESTDSICKRFVIMNNHYQSYAGAVDPTMDNGGNPLCKSP